MRQAPNKACSGQERAGSLGSHANVTGGPLLPLMLIVRRKCEHAAVIRAMNQKDDYASGPHHYWLQFVCGFIFGAFLGGGFARWMFSNLLVMLIGGLITGLCF